MAPKFRISRPVSVNCSLIVSIEWPNVSTMVVELKSLELKSASDSLTKIVEFSILEQCFEDAKSFQSNIHSFS